MYKHKPAVIGGRPVLLPSSAMPVPAAPALAALDPSGPDLATAAS